MPGKGPIKNPVTPARATALDALLDVERSGAFASLALDQRMNRARLVEVDRRLAVEICYGTLENRLYIDWLLSRYMERMPGDATLREVLRMSVYQILFLDRVPDDAVCSQAADILRARNLEGFGPLCFAVLKKITREKDELPVPPEDDPLERISLMYSVPRWIVERMIAQHGETRARAFLAHKPRHGSTTVYVNPMHVDSAQKVLEELDGRACTIPGCYRVRGNAARVDAFHEGIIGVQGEASQLCARLTGAARGQRVLDVCAAPGGKSAYMACMMGGTGRVFAWDAHEHRIELIAKTARRMGFESIRPALQDATQPKPDLYDTMDAVLVDAPCSGLGMIHEKPDLRYRITPEDTETLPPVQAAILNQAAAYVKRGGVLVYATCTLVREENQDIIAAFLKKHPEFEPHWPEGIIPEAWRGALSPGEGLTLWPQEHGTDGFYIMRMRRIG